MNVRRFSARTARDALSMVRLALGGDAVVLSTKPSGDGVEVLAMAPETMRSIEEMAATPAPRGKDGANREPWDFEYSVMPEDAADEPAPKPQRGQRIEPTMQADNSVDEDVKRLSMSTLSFQDYVRERMLKRRQESMASKARAAEPASTAAPLRSPEPDRASVLEQRMADGVATRSALTPAPQMMAPSAAPQRELPSLHDSVPMRAETPQVNSQMTTQASAQDSARARRDQADMMSELRSVKGLIEQRFDALAFIEKLQRQPGQARLTQKLLDCGLSPALIRKLSDSLPSDVADEAEWAAGVLERNLLTAEAESPLEDEGGVFALVGATGVGKTTTTAKIAAAFATKYGAANLGLITLDAYRVAAHEQLRAYGRILGVPVHTAHDRASLEDLLDLLSGKKMVLIDTAGMAQRDTRTRELLDMLSHRAIQRLLVVNAASQGETIEDVLVAYRAASCKGIVLSKMDEAVKLGPAIDALIRHKLKVIGVANGQRVPEDWHRLTASALVQRALRGGGSSAYKLDASDVSLVFAAPHGSAQAAAHASMHAQHA
jgi:flagellar biosynthesis protein FlhF